MKYNNSGSNVFYLCSALSQVKLTSGLIMIGDSMFSMNNGPSALASIEIPSSVTSIGKTLDSFNTL